MTYWQYLGISAAVIGTDATMHPVFRLVWAVMWGAVTLKLAVDAERERKAGR